MARSLLISVCLIFIVGTNVNFVSAMPMAPESEAHLSRTVRAINLPQGIFIFNAFQSIKKQQSWKSKWGAIEESPVMSLEIRPWQRYTPLPHTENMLYRATISSLTLNLRSRWSLGWYAHADGICAPFYCIS